MSGSSVVAGPVLFARGSDDTHCRVSVLMVLSLGSASEYAATSAAERTPPAVRNESVVGDVPTVRVRGGDPAVPMILGELGGHRFLAYDLEMPVATTVEYEVDGQTHKLMSDMTGDLRVAYVSCNGLERGDVDRADHERNRMWRRLLQEHRQRPFALLLQGGDQLYADEAGQAHPLLEQWSEADLNSRADIAFTQEARTAAEHFFVERYCSLYAQPDVAPLLASVPSMMMWDDHDIFDGWGSHPPELLDSPIGMGLFTVARQAFLLFQRALPLESARSLSHSACFPRLRVLAPDLRSERRMDRVLGPAGWQKLESEVQAARGTEHVILMSSVPLLGPRLSWIERLIPVVPRLRRYEDDLRDQWQSRAHRSEWRRLLLALDPLASSGSAMTVVSGEIHLASRGEMPMCDGSLLHQLIASGIAHPAPPAAWATCLGWLARLGENPVKGRDIRLKPLPGRTGIYTAERNYLVMTRHADRWYAEWECEQSGRTPALDLSSA